jgi:hypothetical protein
MTDDVGTPTARHRTRRARRVRLVAGAVAVLLLIAMAVWVLRPDDATPVAARPATTPTSTPSPSPTPTPSPCESPATGEFTPTRITFPGVARNLKVIALPRDGRNVPSVPPVSQAGKHQVAWDRPPGIKPGSPKGNVLLNAHTWPDGSALGNELLDDLEKGDRVILRGHGSTLCYEVDQEIEVLDANGYPPYFDREGPPQIAIIVCSGRRLGPGQWTHRTIWFAKPVRA